MADHAAGSEPAVVKTEPAASTEIARLVVAALVALGVFEFDDATWNTITLVIGGLVSIGFSWWTRRTVTPTAKPKTDDGIPLVPATPPAASGTPPATPPPTPPPPTAL